MYMKEQAWRLCDPFKGGKEPIPANVICFQLQAPCQRGERILPWTTWLLAWCPGHCASPAVGGSPCPGMLAPASLWAHCPEHHPHILYPCEDGTHRLPPSAPEQSSCTWHHAFENCSSVHPQQGLGRRATAWCPMVVPKTHSFPGLVSLFPFS